MNKRVIVKKTLPKLQVALDSVRSISLQLISHDSGHRHELMSHVAHYEESLNKIKEWIEPLGHVGSTSASASASPPGLDIDAVDDVESNLNVNAPPAAQSGGEHRHFAKRPPKRPLDRDTDEEKAEDFVLRHPPHHPPSTLDPGVPADGASFGASLNAYGREVRTGSFAHSHAAGSSFSVGVPPPSVPPSPPATPSLLAPPSPPSICDPLSERAASLPTLRLRVGHGWWPALRKSTLGRSLSPPLTVSGSPPVAVDPRLTMVLLATALIGGVILDSLSKASALLDYGVCAFVTLFLLHSASLLHVTSDVLFVYAWNLAVHSLPLLCIVDDVLRTPEMVAERMHTLRMPSVSLIVMLIFFCMGTIHGSYPTLRNHADLGSLCLLFYTRYSYVALKTAEWRLPLAGLLITQLSLFAGLEAGARLHAYQHYLHQTFLCSRRPACTAQVSLDDSASQPAPVLHLAKGVGLYSLRAKC